MKDKKKQGAQPTVSLMFEERIPFHEMSEYCWAYGLAIIGTSHESLSEALMAFEELLLFQSLFNSDPSASENLLELDIRWPNNFERPFQNSPLIYLPISAGVLWEIYKIHKDEPEAKDILRKYYPKLLEQHNQLYQLRDPHEDGLITNLHPWETGYGLSAHWQDALSNALGKKTVSEDQPSHSFKEKNAYQLIAQLSAADPHTTALDFGFRVQDPLFHAFLSWGNESLIQMGGLLGEDVQDIMEKYELSIYSINERLWSTKHRQYCPYDQNTKRPIPIDVLQSAMCLFSEIATQDQAEELYPQLERQLKIEMQAKITAEELHPLSIARRILLLQALGNYGFDELSFLLLQRLTFLLQQAIDNDKNHQPGFLIKGFHLFINN